MDVTNQNKVNINYIQLCTDLTIMVNSSLNEKLYANIKYFCK